MRSTSWPTARFALQTAACGIVLGTILFTASASATADETQGPRPEQGQPEPVDQAEARQRLHQIVTFYRNEVGYQGAYLWRYSANLDRQEGEGKATATSGWTQPPGTPAVGAAYLDAWRMTGDQVLLDAAVEAARALVRAQLNSGGWSSHFDLGQDGRQRYAYRVDGPDAGRNNYTTFDDNKSQAALVHLMRVDEVLEFQDPEIHEAVEFALEKMLVAQYPNGAWPQQYDQPPDPDEHPVLQASYPESWPRQFPKEDYRDYYTLNDNNMSHIVDMLFEAYRIYDREDCYRAAEKTGEFFLLAQMPEPQPGWAQQYDLQMHPSWARKFEPPAITGGESQSVMRALLKLYERTGRRDFLEPLPRALAYYERSLLPDGKLARFYELRTNRPLYFTKEYELTYSDEDLPTHYAFQVSSKLEGIERAYERLAGKPLEKRKPQGPQADRVELTDALRKRAQAVLHDIDSRGAWIERGEMRGVDKPLDVIDMRTFIENLDIVARYVGAR